MKICYITPTFYPAKSVGGPTISSFNKCKLLSKNNNFVTVLTTNSDGKTKIDIKDGQIRKINRNFEIKYFNEIVTNFISWSFYINILLNLRKYDFIIIDDLFSGYSLLSIYYALILKKKFVLIPRGVLSDWSLNNSSKYIKLLWIKLFINPVHKKIVWEATTNHEKKQIINIFPKSNAIVIPNGIDLDIYKSVKKLNKNEYHKKFIKGKLRYSKVIVFIGRLHPVKNLSKLIYSFEKLIKNNRKFVLLIAGNDAGDKSNLVELVNSLNIKENVKFVGFLNKKNKIRFLKGANLSICISKTENFANVVLEACACATPSIVSKEVPWKVLEKYNCGKQITATESNLLITLKEFLFYEKGKEPKRDFKNLTKIFSEKNLRCLTNLHYRKLLNERS